MRRELAFSHAWDRSDPDDRSQLPGTHPGRLLVPQCVRGAARRAVRLRRVGPGLDGGRAPAVPRPCDRDGAHAAVRGRRARAAQPRGAGLRLRARPPASRRRDREQRGRRPFPGQRASARFAGTPPSPISIPRAPRPNLTILRGQRSSTASGWTASARPVSSSADGSEDRRAASRRSPPARTVRPRSCCAAGSTGERPPGGREPDRPAGHRRRLGADRAAPAGRDGPMPASTRCSWRKSSSRHAAAQCPEDTWDIHLFPATDPRQGRARASDRELRAERGGLRAQAALTRPRPPRGLGSVHAAGDRARLPRRPPTWRCWPTGSRSCAGWARARR